MSEMRVIKVDSYWSCLVQGCPLWHEGQEENIVPTCPLPKWPSVSHGHLRKKAIQIWEDSNLGQMHILHIFEELMKELNVEIEEEK